MGSGLQVWLCSRQTRAPSLSRKFRNIRVVLDNFLTLRCSAYHCLIKGKCSTSRIASRPDSSSKRGLCRDKVSLQPVNLPPLTDLKQACRFPKERTMAARQGTAYWQGQVGSALAKAIDYSLKRWPALICYADSGDLPIDNNPVENTIWPIAIGK